MKKTRIWIEVMWIAVLAMLIALAVCNPLINNLVGATLLVVSSAVVSAFCFGLILATYEAENEM